MALDPEMSSTKKGNDGYCCMKAHISVGVDSGVTHDLDPSTEKLHDSQVWDALLHSKGTSVWTDNNYVRAESEDALKGSGRVWGAMRKAPKGSDIHPLDARLNSSSS